MPNIMREVIELDEMDIMDSLHRLTRLTKRLQTDGKRHHSHGKSRLLNRLRENDGISAKELALKMEIRPPSLSEALDRLEEHGMIERRRDEKDSRVQRIFLTRHGYDELERRTKECAEIRAQLDSCLTTEEKQAFCGLCERLSAHLETLTAQKTKESC